MLYKIISIVVITVICIVFGIVLPTLKRKRCTNPVNAMVSNRNRKRVGISVDSNIVEADKVTVKYFYNGKSYQKRMCVEIGATLLNIFVNPNKPEEFVPQSTKSYWEGIVINALIIAVTIFLTLI